MQGSVTFNISFLSHLANAQAMKSGQGCLSQGSQSKNKCSIVSSVSLRTTHLESTLGAMAQSVYWWVTIAMYIEEYTNVCNSGKERS